MRPLSVLLLAATLLLTLIAPGTPALAAPGTEDRPEATEPQEARVEVTAPLRAELMLSEDDDSADEPSDQDPPGPEVLLGSTDTSKANDSMALPGDKVYTADLLIDASAFRNELGPLNLTLQNAHGPTKGVVAAHSSQQKQPVGADLDSRMGGTSSTQIRPGDTTRLGWAFTEPGTYCLELGLSSVMSAGTAEKTRIRRDSVGLRVHVGAGEPQPECDGELASSDGMGKVHTEPITVDQGRARIVPHEDGSTAPGPNPILAEVAEGPADLSSGTGELYDASQVVWSASLRGKTDKRWHIPAEAMDAGLNLGDLGKPGRATALMRIHSGPGTGQFLSASDPLSPHDLLVPPEGRDNDRIAMIKRASPSRESTPSWNFENEGRYCIDLTVRSTRGDSTATTTTRLTFAAGKDASEVKPCAEPGADIPDIPLPDTPDGDGGGDGEDGSDGDGDGEDGGDGSPRDDRGQDGGSGPGSANGKLPAGTGDGLNPGDGEESAADDEPLTMPPAAQACQPVHGDKDVQIREGNAVLTAGQHGAALLDKRPSKPINRVPDKATFVLSEDAKQTVDDDGLDGFAAAGSTVFRTEAGPQDAVPWLGWDFEDVPEDGQLTWSVDRVEGPGEFAILTTDALGVSSVMLSAEQSAQFTAPTAEYGSWAFTRPGYYQVWTRLTVEAADDSEDTEIVVPMRFSVGELGSKVSDNPILHSFLGECTDSMFNGAFPSVVPPAEDPPAPFLGGGVPIWQWVLAGIGLAVALVLGALVLKIAMGIGRTDGKSS